MTIKFKKDIIKAISFVPGLVGITRIEPDYTNKALPSKDWDKGIIIDETSEGLYIRISIIIDIDIRAKIVSKEVTSAIRSVVKKNKYKLKKINIYIRGIR